MNSTRRTIFIVSADAAVTQGCIHELDAAGGHYLMRTASSVELARREFHRSAPAVVFLDESAVNASQNGDSLEFAVAQLTDTAPVVVAATPDKQALLEFLITSGAVDFVPRTDRFLSIAAGLKCEPYRSVVGGHQESNQSAEWTVLECFTRPSF